MFTAEPATKQYIDLFRAFWTDPSMSLLEGMVVLWATETCYLSAWGYAKSFIDTSDPPLQKVEDRKSRATSEGVMSELEGSEVNTAVTTGTTGDAAGTNNDNHAQNQNQNHSADHDGGALRDSFIPNLDQSRVRGLRG